MRQILKKTFTVFGLVCLLFSITCVLAGAESEFSYFGTNIIDTDDGSEYIEEIYYSKEPYPMGLHLLWNNSTNPETMMVMLSGTGMKFQTNFFTPKSQNLARFYTDMNFMVVGIDYRETLVDYNPNEEYKIMKNWDVKEYVKDIRKAVRFSQKKTAIDQYGITGHSLGGILTLAYASKYQHDNNLQSIAVLENGQFDPETEQDKVEKAINDSNALRQDIKNGSYVNPGMLEFAYMMAIAQAYPDENNFSDYYNNSEFVLISLIYTSQFPGNWQFNQGFCDGDMINGLYYSPIEVMYDAGLNGTIYPMVVESELYAYMGNLIDYSDVNVPVMWINTEGGKGESGNYSANKIREKGNEDVEFVLVEGGHADIAYGIKDGYANGIWDEYLSQL